jgi:hypothetical protein
MNGFDIITCIKTPLKPILKASIKQGVFPDLLKVAEIRPVWVMNKKSVTIDLYRFYLYSLKFWKE